MSAVEGFESGFVLPDVAGVVNRRDYFLERASGVDVVHLGCVDDRLTEARFATGALLHEELNRVTRSLVGVDISADGIERLRRLVPGDYLVGDVERLDEIPLPPRCDLVVAAELIEHLGAPGQFLEGLRTYLAATGAVALITTPNAYSWSHFVRMSTRRREWTHPDHRLVYTPVTLQRTLELAGLRMTSLRAHAWSRSGTARAGLLNAIDRTVLRWNPLLAVGLVAEVRPA